MAAAPPRGVPLPARLLLGGGALALLGALGCVGVMVWSGFRGRAPKAAPTPVESPVRKALPRGGWSLAAYCPEATVAFASVRDLEGIAGRARQSDLSRILASPAVAGLLEAARDLAPPSGSWLLDPSRRAALVAGLMDAGSGEVALALTEIEKPESYRPVPHVLLAIRPAEGRSEILEPMAERLFGALLASSRGLERRESNHGGLRIQMVGDADVAFAWAVQDGVLLAASHESTLRGALDLGAGRGDSLKSSPVFQEVLRDAGVKCDLFAYLNLARVWEAMPVSERPSSASGISDIDCLAGGLQIDPPVCVERLILHTAKARSGFLEVLENDPLPEIPPGPLPPRLLSYSRANLEVNRAWTTCMKTAQKVLNPAETRVVLAAIEAFNKQMGFRIQEDLIQSLGGVTTSVTVAGPDASKPESVTLWALRDPTRFKGCVDSALGSLDRLESKPLVRRWVDGLEVFAVDPEAWNTVMPWSYPRGVPGISFGVVQGALVASDRPELVSAWGRPRKDAVENEGLKKAWEARPPKAWAFSYADLSEWGGSGAWSSKLKEMQRGSGALPTGVGPLLGAFPASFLAERISPFTAAVFNSPRSVILECRGPVPVVTAGAAAVAGTLALPPFLEPAQKTAP